MSAKAKGSRKGAFWLAKRALYMRLWKTKKFGLDSPTNGGGIMGVSL